MGWRQLLVEIPFQWNLRCIIAWRWTTTTTKWKKNKREKYSFIYFCFQFELLAFQICVQLRLRLRRLALFNFMEKSLYFWRKLKYSNNGHEKEQKVHNCSKILPMASSTQPTVPSPPQHITLKFGTSLNIVNPSSGPPFDKSYTCRGFKRYWNFRNILSPCRPPDFGLTNTSTGHNCSDIVIWKCITFGVLPP